MEIVFVRHALPERIDMPSGVAAGPADPGLTPHGLLQAERVRAALADEAVDGLYTSPMRRARQTAAPLAAERGLEPVVVDGLAEYDREHVTYVPVEQRRAEGGPAWEALKNGELGLGIDAEAFRATVVAAVEGIVAAHPGGRAVLFAHAGVINIYCGAVAGVEKPIWLAPAYASVTRIGASRDGRRGLVSVNETAHVRDLLARDYPVTTT